MNIGGMHMKLLIVEDEEITRKSMMNVLNWTKLGIKNVQTAENGRRGIMSARRFKPDIIITDVRMPKMDGISMVERISSFLPECRMIFLSAYSNKEYYKAALKLKAVYFIEKPIVKEELEQVVIKAIQERRELQFHESTYKYKRSIELEKIAEKMTHPNIEYKYEEELLKLFPERFTKEHTRAITIIIKLKLESNETTVGVWEDIITRLEEIAQPMKIVCSSTLKKNSHMIIHLFSKKCLSNTTVNYIRSNIEQLLKDIYSYYIAIGKQVNNINNTYQSYHSAVILLQKAFYYPYGQVLQYSENVSEDIFRYDYTVFKEAVLNELFNLNQKSALQKLKEFYNEIIIKKDIITNRVKEVYYTFILEILRIAETDQVNIKLSSDEETTWLDEVEKLNYIELHQFTVDKLNDLFKEINNSKDEKSQITAIKAYISRNYGNSLLSVKDISEYLNLSNSHMCTIFKKETGYTVNQFITNYRIQKAKQYLRDIKYTVSEISEKIGYKDNSYFGRIFKKIEGITPMEYREGWKDAEIKEVN